MVIMTSSTEEKEEQSPDMFELDDSSPNKPLVKRVPKTGETSPRTDHPEGESPDHAGLALNWGKKYQPKALKDFICHRQKAIFLASLVSSGNIDHCVIQGPSGVGKTTMALAMLGEEFGSSIINETREEVREFKLIRSPETKLDFEDYVNSTCTSIDGPIASILVKVKASPLHIEVDLSDIKWYMNEAVLELIKEIHNRNNKQSQRTKSIRKTAIILNEADRLSEECQVHIRKYLESSAGHYQVIFCCYDVCRLHLLMPLCVIVQLLPPSDREIVDVLSFIAKQEGIELSEKLASRIARKSKHCLQQAIRSFSATWQSEYPFKEDQVVMTGWEQELVIAARSIIEDQTPTGLFTFRKKLQILLKHNVCPEFIFSTLVDELKRQFDDQTYPQLSQLYQAYARERRQSVEGKIPSSVYGRLPCYKLRARVNPFMKIEEFVALFMSLCKNSS